MSALALLAVSLASAGVSLPDVPAPAAPSARQTRWTLQWSDEFSGPRGASADPRKWRYETGGDGWGNQELQHYCAHGSGEGPCDARRPNGFQDGQGGFVIEARKSSDTWTSARLVTRGLAEFRHGRLEARMKLPSGAGLWPAFWMLGNDDATAGWPGCGEIDIMENIPNHGGNPLGPERVQATLHGPGYSGAGSHGGKYRFPRGQRVDGEYHVYGAIWSPGRIDFYVDDWTKPFFRTTPQTLPAGGVWVFEHPFFFIMNLAVGGSWPGYPDESTPNPARVLVDYVRVYTPAK